MIVRISIFDTIINLYKPYIMVNCIKIVSKIHFLTFGDGTKINKELSLCDLALYLSCLGRATLQSRFRWAHLILMNTNISPMAGTCWGVC